MSKTHELISAIYAATLIPEDFNRKFDNLDDLLFGDSAARVPEPSEAGGGRIDPTAYPHIAIARSIQERIGRAASPVQKLDGILQSIPNPSYLVSDKGSVVAANAMAQARHRRMPATLADCIADANARGRVRDFMARGNSGRLLAVAGHADTGDGAQTSFLIKRVEPALLPDQNGPHFLLSVVDLGFDAGAVELFRETYDLTDAESRVAVLLASGLRLPDIAAERQVSIDTVRTQIKVIKHKTGARDIPALVRLLCGFNAGAIATAVVRPVPSGARGGPLRVRRQIALPDGRQMQYVEQGAPDGDVVLMFHNLPYGVDLPEAALNEAYRRGLRIIAPFRPGFGGSQAADERGDALLTRVAADTRELLRQLGVGRVAAVSHSTSAPFALRFSSMFPDMVSRLVGVARPPAWRDEWMRTTPQRQRFMLRLTKFAPQVLPVVAWAMVACMDSSYASDFVVYNCKDGPADLKAVQDPEIVDLIAKGSVEALRNGLDGFCRECELAMFDFTAEARAAPHKFHMLHGSDDRIVDIAQTMTFARDVPGTAVEVVEGAGQLLFFSHWRRVLDAVDLKVLGVRAA